MIPLKYLFVHKIYYLYLYYKRDWMRIVDDGCDEDDDDVWLL